MSLKKVYLTVDPVTGIVMDVYTRRMYAERSSEVVKHGFTVIERILLNRPD